MTVAWSVFVPALILPAVGLAGPLPPYFPLEPGYRWVYALSGFPGASQEIEVLGREDGRVTVLFNRDTVQLLDGGNDIDIELEGEGQVPFYRFAEDSWLHRDFRGCEDKREVRAAARDEVVETPYDVFTGALRLEFGPGVCADAGLDAEWWVPEFGLVKWSEVWIGGIRSWELVAFEQNQPSPLFRRGDADADGELSINDPVVVLGWLFLAGAVPACVDGADGNDDATVDIADPVSILTYLFLGGAELPAPGPRECGKDVTPDELGCQAPCPWGEEPI